MFTMGNSCTAMQREDTARRRTRDETCTDAAPSTTHSSLRHAVVREFPNQSIPALYPVQDNCLKQVEASNSHDHTSTIVRRNPKSLASLCVDAVCRALPHTLESLPKHLPPDVVEDIIASLHEHAAWNTSTMQVLLEHCCETGTLDVSRCRGVTDTWFEQQQESASSTTSASIVMEEDADESSPSESFYGALDEYDDSFSSASFVSATSDHSQTSMTITMDTTADPSPFTTPSASMEIENDTTDDDETGAHCLTVLDVSHAQHLTDRGLSNLLLQRSQHLQVARLEHCHSLTHLADTVFQHAKHQLHTLSLAHCRRLTDHAVRNISCKALQDLNLQGCRCLTDRSLAAIAQNLVQLRRLNVSQCDLLTDDGMMQYMAAPALPLLQEVSVGWCRQLTDRGIQALVEGRGRCLRVLQVARCAIGNGIEQYLGSLTELRELDLNGCTGIKSRALANVLERLAHLEVLDVSYIPGILRWNWQGKIRALKSLELCYSNVKDGHIFQLLNQHCLEEINFDSCPVGDSAMAHLADRNVVPNLKRLDLADTNITDAGVAKIALFEHLTHLSLFYCNISNESLRSISKLPHLQVLNLDSRDISDEGLYFLQNLALKSLDIFGGRITDRGCAYICKIKTLESLELCGGGIGDFGCSRLATLERLTCLNLSQNERISNRGAAALAALDKLQSLNLSHTRVSSKGLKFFSGLVELQSLALSGCVGIDNRSLDKLQDRLPNLRCLRVDTCWKEEDGTYLASTSDDDEDDDDDNARLEPIEMMDRDS